MFNIGFGELAIICIVLIVAVGPDRLPSMMKSLGKTMRTLRNASRDLRESTGIDELLRDDFDYRPAPRRPYVAPKPPEPATVSRTEGEAAPAPAESAPGEPAPADPASAAAAPVPGAVPVAPAVSGATLVGVGAPPITAPPPAGSSSVPPPVAAPSGGGTQPGMPAAPEPQPGTPPAGVTDPSKLHGA